MGKRDRQARDWRELTDLTQGAAIVVERVRLAASDIAIEGAFELPQLAQLPVDDQIFIIAFIRSHGSIKEMEQMFGVSYPTIKGRLNKLAAALNFVDVDPRPTRLEVVDRLSRGEISTDEAVRLLEGRK